MENIKISNFRKIKDTWDLDLAPITFFTGKNSSGKSSVLKGLMVLRDYGRSLNHFEIKFNGELHAKHKITDYSNAINWSNNKRSDFSFEYLRDGYKIHVVFSPKKEEIVAHKDEDHYYIGELKSIKITRVFDEARFELSREANVYKIAVDYDLLNLNRDATISTEMKMLQEAYKNTEAAIKNQEEIVSAKIAKLTSLDSAKKVFSFLPGFGGIISAVDYLMENRNDSDQIELVNLKEKVNRLLENQRLLEKKIRKNKHVLANHDNKDKLTLKTSFYLNELSDSDLMINNLIKKVLGNHFRFNKKKLGLLDIENEIEKINEFSAQVLSLFTFDINHLSPHRTAQRKLFIHDNNNLDINSLVKNFTENNLAKNIEISGFIKKWMSKEKFDIGEDFRIVTYESSVSKIEILENENWINISDKGFGAGQIFSILLAISLSIKKHKTVFSSKGSPFYEEDVSIILIEEPEANLHPALQSKLVELFVDALKFGMRFIIETHSEYMIRKSQLLNLNRKEFKLFYFDADGPYEMAYLDNGKFDRDFGTGFYDEAGGITLKMIKELRKNQAK